MNLKLITLLLFTFAITLGSSLSGKELVFKEELKQNGFTNPVITHIDRDQHLIYVSNEMIFKVKVYEAHGFTKESISALLSLWREGDRVEPVWGMIKGSDFYMSWFLTNWDSNFRAHQFIVEIVSQNLPTVEEVSKSGNFVKLSDGSEWHVGWWSSIWSKSWDIGDVVMPVVDRDDLRFGNNTHMLTNMTKGGYINATLTDISP